MRQTRELPSFYHHSIIQSFIQSFHSITQSFIQSFILSSVSHAFFFVMLLCTLRLELATGRGNCSAERTLFPSWLDGLTLYISKKSVIIGIFDLLVALVVCAVASPGTVLKLTGSHRPMSCNQSEKRANHPNQFDAAFGDEVSSDEEDFRTPTNSSRMSAGGSGGEVGSKEEASPA